MIELDNKRLRGMVWKDLDDDYVMGSHFGDTMSIAETTKTRTCNGRTEIATWETSSKPLDIWAA
jgi:hypothetical protein